MINLSRRVSLCSLVLGLSCIGVASGNARAETGSSGYRFRGVLIRNESPATIKDIVFTGSRNGLTQRAFGVHPGVKETKTEHVPAEVNNAIMTGEIDTLYIDFCATLDKTKRSLQAQYPDASMLVGERRLLSAEVFVGADWASGSMIVNFVGGGSATVPLNARRCSTDEGLEKITDPAQVRQALLDRLSQQGNLLVAPSGPKGAEPTPFDTLEVENLSNKIIVKTTARPYLNGTPRPALLVENVPVYVAGLPKELGADLSGINQGNRVCVEVEIQGQTDKLYAASTLLRLISGASVTVAGDGNFTTTVVFTAVGGATELVTAAKSQVCMLQLQVDSASTTKQTVSLWRSTGGTLLEIKDIVAATAGVYVSKTESHATSPGFGDIHVCSPSGFKKKLLVATGGDRIRFVRVRIDAGNTFTITEVKTWGDGGHTESTSTDCP